jgi:hypothetical protein
MTALFAEKYRIFPFWQDSAAYLIKTFLNAQDIGGSLDTQIMKDQTAIQQKIDRSKNRLTRWNR